MGKWFFSSILVLILTVPSSAFGEVGYSGASWGELRHEGGDGESNTLLYGWIDQGIDWLTVGTMRLSTYAVLRYSLDTEGLDWNNSLAPGVGIAVRQGAVKIGAEVFQERLLKSDRTENRAVLYMNWWVGWDLKR